MCGIVGKVDFAGGVDPAVVERMCSAVEHRGPNSRGIWSDDGVAVGAQRLAIIDLVGGDQPIFNEDRTIVVVMNGEIYNFQALRRQLIDRGHRFATQSDTEVLVHLYEDLGDRLVDQLRGMFAFAIWDRRERRLLLGRDRVGKKPLFIARRGSKVWFGSEVMALLQDPEIERRPDPRAILAYLAYQFVPHPMSAFTGMEKLAPASTLSVTADGATARRYWALDYETGKSAASRRELEEQLRELIWEATRMRLIGEVPIGAFLSGGIDSSAVVAAMADQTAAPVKTFSIGFPDADFDETGYARMIAERFATDHHEFIVEPRSVEIMPKLARHYGEPFADASAIPSFYLSELTSRHVTVVLNGDGGDESFAGYGRYALYDAVARLGWVPDLLLAPLTSLGQGRPRNSKLSRIGRLATALAMQPHLRYAEWMSAFRSVDRDRVLQPEFASSANGWRPESVIAKAWLSSTADSTLDRMLDADVQTYLPDDLLVKMDIATMAHSVEGRSPFLDHHLMEFAAALPSTLKLRAMPPTPWANRGKVLLRSALRDLLPDATVNRPKMGFGVPLAQWFREELRDLPREVLLGSDARVQAYVKPEAIRQMIEEHQDSLVDHSARLWALLQLEMWHREVVESPIRR